MQFESPSQGDFIQLIKDDFKLINKKFDKKIITSMSKNQFKKWVKLRVEKAALN